MFAEDEALEVEADVRDRREGSEAAGMIEGAIGVVWRKSDEPLARVNESLSDKRRLLRIHLLA